MARPFAYVVFDGERLTADTATEGRRMRIDSRCLAGTPVEGAYAHVCALTDGDALVRAAACELVLEALVAQKRLSRSSAGYARAPQRGPDPGKGHQGFDPMGGLNI